MPSDGGTLTRTDSGPLTTAYEAAVTSPDASGFLLARGDDRDAVGGRRAGTVTAAVPAEARPSTQRAVVIEGRGWGLGKWFRCCCFSFDVSSS